MAAGNQQNNYSVFSAGDKVIIAGRACSEAVTVASQPAGDTWNLYFSSGYPGASGTGVQMAKVTGGSISSSGTSSSSSSGSSSSTSSSSGTGTPLSQLITASDWSILFPNISNSGCHKEAAQIYTYQNFLSAAASYPAFAQTGSDATRKREIAAFLANISHETTGGWSSAPGGPYAWGLCYVEELKYYPDQPDNGAYTSNSTTYPAVAGVGYHGRGPIQISWNVNYGQASQAIYGDKTVLLNHPENVISDGVVAFKTALWFWMTAQSPKPSAHDVMANGVSGGAYGSGFGLTINIINGGIECGSGASNTAGPVDRSGFYQRYMTYFNQTITDSDLTCASDTPY